MQDQFETRRPGGAELLHKHISKPLGEADEQYGNML